jgi:hypothetical protein
MAIGGKLKSLEGKFIGFGGDGSLDKKTLGLGCTFTLPLATGTTLIDWGDIACK